MGMYLSDWVIISSNINLPALKPHLPRIHNWRVSDTVQCKTGGKTRKNQGVGQKRWGLSSAVPQRQTWMIYLKKRGQVDPSFTSVFYIPVQFPLTLPRTVALTKPTDSSTVFI